MNTNMVNMNPMGGPVGAPMPMMNNGAAVPQQAAGVRQVPSDNNRSLLNTYIYEYFLRYGMYDCARSLLSTDNNIHTAKDSPSKNGINGLGDDPMDTDSKEDLDKRPDDLPAPTTSSLSDSCFLYEWFCLFWDMFNAQRGKGVGGNVNQYVSHTQAQSRLRQNQQQELLRGMRPNGGGFNQEQFGPGMMRNMPNGGMNMSKMQGNLRQAAIANNQNNPQMQMLQQKNQMQRDPSAMDGDRQRPQSPSSTDNAPSPSKRPRLEGGAPFNPNQPGMMPNGRPGAQQGMPVQQVGPASNAQLAQMLITNGINPSAVNQGQLQVFAQQSPAVQAKTIATYAANLQQHHGNQMPNKPMPNAAGPQSHGSPMVAPGPDGIQTFYNAEPGNMRAGAPGANQAAGGSNHALQDYQMQLMLLEQQNKKRLMMARQEQDGMNGGMPGRDGPGGPAPPGAPNPQQQFQGASPQGSRTGASPNPAEQMKRSQMNAANMGSPLPEGAAAQNRASPSPMNFMGNQMDPNMPQHFYNGMKGMDGNMVAAQMNGGMRPPNAHPGAPGQPFNGQMNTQQLMQARQQAQQQQQQPGQGQGNPQMQWQQGGPNGNQMPPQGPQGPQGPVQGTPQQRSMPPPSAPAAAAGATPTARNTASPQTSNAAPPTPNQTNKANPKKKDTKNAKDKKAATQKKSNSNLNSGATPSSEAQQESEAPTPATPITPSNPQGFKNGQNAGVQQGVPSGQPAASAPPPAAPVAPQPPTDPMQNQGFSMDSNSLDFTNLDFANPLTSDNVLDQFDFETFLQDDPQDGGNFDFDSAGFTMGEGIGAD